MNALTPREKEVLALLAQGMSTAAISKELTITCTTVRNHIQSILSKLRARSRLEAVACAMREGLI